jgi:hypothetical protein
VGRRRDLGRRPPTRELFPRYLIVCEGDVTERRYLEDLRKEERIPIDLRFRAGAVPKTLVHWAVEEKKAAEGDPYDEVWVVFDVDEHPDVAAGKDRATANDLRVAVSNPCFELWALLHFEFWSSSIERDKLRKRCVKHIARV